MPEEICSFDGCESRAQARKLCAAHWWQMKNWGYMKPVRRKKAVIPCPFPGCEYPIRRNGYCSSHARQMKQGGSLRPLRKSGDWYTQSSGYVIRKYRNDAGKLITVRQHREVMETHLGRKLISGENVHHINGVRDDNRIENLELWSTSQPSGQRVVDKVAWAREILDLYGKDY